MGIDGKGVERFVDFEFQCRPRVSIDIDPLIRRLNRVFHNYCSPCKSICDKSESRFFETSTRHFKRTSGEPTIGDSRFLAEFEEKGKKIWKRTDYFDVSFRSTRDRDRSRCLNDLSCTCRRCVYAPGAGDQFCWRIGESYREIVTVTAKFPLSFDLNTCF